MKYLKTKYSGLMNLKSYKSLINEIKLNGYKFSFFANKSKKKQIVFLRHDVDILPDDAMRIAELEKKLGVKSTFFFLVNTNLYNINSKKVKFNILKIIKLGHKIGLHYDGENSLKKNTFKKDVESQCNVIENIINQKVDIISFHKPRKSFLNYSKKIANREHTYMPKYFSLIGYISDSQGIWKYGIPTEKDFFISKKSFQLLTHPEWWVGKEKSANRKFYLERIKQKLLEKNKDDMESTFSNFSFEKNSFLSK